MASGWILLGWLLWLAAPAAAAEQPAASGQDAARSGPESPEIQAGLAAARARLERGDAPGAAERLEALLAAHPELRAARLLLGKAYLQQKKYQHALNAYSAVLLADPHVPQAASGRALALAGLGDVPKAITWAKKATEMAPDDLAAWEVLGRIYLTPNYLDAPRAEATFRQMLVLDPHNRTARLLLARALSYEKKVEQAVELLQGLAAERPDDWQVQYKLAESYYALGQLSRAEKLLQRMLAARPDDRQAQRLLTAIEDRQDYMFWVPVAAALLIPLLYLLFRRLKRGRVVRD